MVTREVARRIGMGMGKGCEKRDSMQEKQYHIETRSQTHSQTGHHGRKKRDKGEREREREKTGHDVIETNVERATNGEHIDFHGIQHRDNFSPSCDTHQLSEHKSD